MAGSISIISRKGHISVDGEVIDKADGPAPGIIINIFGGESIVGEVEADATSKLTAFSAQDGSGNRRAKEGTIESDDEYENSKECSLRRRL